MLLTPKLAQTLSHATRGPQVSFAVAMWRLGIPARVLNFVNAMLSRKGHPKFEKVMEAPPCCKITWDDRRHVGKHDGVLCFKAVPLLFFIYDVHGTSKRGCKMDSVPAAYCRNYTGCNYLKRHPRRKIEHPMGSYLTV